MALYPEDEWKPVFPEPAPEHWLALVFYADETTGVLSDLTLSASDRAWLSTWLSSHSPRDPEGEASYVFLGIGSPDFVSQPADGMKNPKAITGTGSGMEVAEPPGATASTIGRIYQVASATLMRS